MNPLSRTAQRADITIVDNVIRVFPLLVKMYNKISSHHEAEVILDNYDNKLILKQALKKISEIGNE